MMIKLAIFDLDGTLLNTLEDLTDSCNYTLESYSYPKRKMSEIRRILGYGVRNLVESILPDGVKLSPHEFESFFDTYKNHYAQNKQNNTKPYDGIEEMLEKLKNENVKLAIISNKAHNNTLEIAQHYFPDVMEVVFGQRENVPLKPNPQSLLEVMEICGTEKSEVCCVGDGETDMEVAIAAGVTSIGVTWGFRDREELAEAGATFIAENTDELFNYIIKNKTP